MPALVGVLVEPDPACPAGIVQIVLETLVQIMRDSADSRPVCAASLAAAPGALATVAKLTEQRAVRLGCSCAAATRGGDSGGCGAPQAGVVDDWGSNYFQTLALALALAMSAAPPATRRAISAVPGLLTAVTCALCYGARRSDSSVLMRSLAALYWLIPAASSSSNASSSRTPICADEAMLDHWQLEARLMVQLANALNGAAAVAEVMSKPIMGGCLHNAYGGVVVAAMGDRWLNLVLHLLISVEQQLAQSRREQDGAVQPAHVASACALAAQLLLGAAARQADSTGAAAEQPPARPHLTKACATCGRGRDAAAGIQLRLCGGCEALCYCSKACQAAAWKAGHKAECKAAARAGAAPGRARPRP